MLQTLKRAMNISDEKNEIFQKAKDRKKQIEATQSIPPTGKHIITHLEKRFIAPASVKPVGHGNKEGGLLIHSLEVCIHALDYLGSRIKSDTNRCNQAIVLSLAHDLGKLIAYGTQDGPFAWNYQSITDKNYQSDEGSVLTNIDHDPHAAAQHDSLSIAELYRAIGNREKQAINDVGGIEGWRSVLCGLAYFHSPPPHDAPILKSVQTADDEATAHGDLKIKRERLNDFLSSLKHALHEGDLIYDAPGDDRNAGERLDDGSLWLYLTREVIRTVNEHLRKRGIPGLNQARLWTILRHQDYRVEKDDNLIKAKIGNFF